MTRTVLRRVQPEAEAIRGIGRMSHEKLSKAQARFRMISRIPWPENRFTKFRPFLSGHHHARVNQNVIGIIGFPAVGLDVVRIEHQMPHAFFYRIAEST